MAIDTAPQNQRIAQLKSEWDNLHDLDRAAAVADLKRSSLSVRSIARALGRSESSLRHLLSALLAPSADRHAARHGTISTSELVRRARSAAQQHEAQKRQAALQDRHRKVMEVSKTISQWLKKESHAGARGEAIALEARNLLMMDYSAGKLPHADPQVLHPAAEWIERSRPKTPIPEQSSETAWYALWLARWSFCLCRGAELAIDALGIAGRL